MLKKDHDKWKERREGGNSHRLWGVLEQMRIKEAGREMESVHKIIL